MAHKQLIILYVGLVGVVKCTVMQTQKHSVVVLTGNSNRMIEKFSESASQLILRHYTTDTFILAWVNWSTKKGRVPDVFMVTHDCL